MLKHSECSFSQFVRLLLIEQALSLCPTHVDNASMPAIFPIKFVNCFRMTGKTAPVGPSREFSKGDDRFGRWVGVLF